MPFAVEIRCWPLVYSRRQTTRMWGADVQREARIFLVRKEVVWLGSCSE